jgi:predicted CXXCH cytochrome family protein
MTKKRLLILGLLLISISAVVYAISGQPHLFRKTECSLCHTDAKARPDLIKPTVTLACESCHTRMNLQQSHPTDVYPDRPIPEDMPLLDGKLTCLTCHYTHPKDNMQFIQSDKFLRRMSRGIYFCGICHDIDKNNHIVVENVHPGTYNETNRNIRLDSLSLACIQCHDTYIRAPVSSLGAGTWNHYKKELNHPVGISLDRAAMRNRRNFHSAAEVSQELELYNGNIGCGTCHNIFSGNRKMLVMDNRGSRLCLICHIK